MSNQGRHHDLVSTNAGPPAERRPTVAKKKKTKANITVKDIVHIIMALTALASVVLPVLIR
jgi:hypothetical protein